MVDDTGQADGTHDRRYRAFVLLATFASLRWGDIDLNAGTVRARMAYVERSTREIVLGLPKSKAGRRPVGPSPVRRSGFNRRAGWKPSNQPGSRTWSGTIGHAMTTKIPPGLLVTTGWPRAPIAR
ncbi:hypothetical protein [Nonomuraea sp. SBT364]|uniref:hypothetical protein n=1 Tax=Nonomuraea sp. SBT364 TaxID=1580530 RepID=UPI00066B2937|nr:hypothetical protein [Nonomuraea sp. SBT364]